MVKVIDRPTPAGAAVTPRIAFDYQPGAETPKVNGPAMAALVAAGIGSAALGLLVVLSEAVPAVKTFMDFYSPVGPLAGKSTYAVVAYLVSWGILAALWKGKEISFPIAYIATLVLIALGLIGSFPLFFEAFTVR